MHWVCVQGEKKKSSHRRATDLNFNLQTVALQATTQTSFQLQFFFPPSKHHSRLARTVQCQVSTAGPGLIHSSVKLQLSRFSTAQ